MSKIRINELARELEVKPNRILELLPEFGISDKKTHSSSIDEDVALQLKRRFVEEGLIPPFEEAARASEPERRSSAVAVEERPVERSRPAPAERTGEEEMAVERAGDAAAGSAELPAAPELSAAPPAEAAFTPPPRPVAAPIRPPLAGGTRPAMPAAPAAPPTPAAPPPSAPVQASTTAVPPAAVPGAPRPPVRPPAAPARGVPIYRPGQQVPSGPRQPLPPIEHRPAATPGAPRPSVPQQPAPPRPTMRPAPPAGITVPQRPGQTAAGPAGGQQGRPALVGQPAARPVVPPRPELLARIQQTRPMPGQAAPPPPRPGMPSRPSSPLPGQPIYRGPIRPGQPQMRGPGGPGGPGQMRGPAGRGRPMHPTSPLRVEPAAPPPGETQRRLQAKRGTAVIERDRDREGLDKHLRPTARAREDESKLAAGKEVTIAEGITVKELSEKLGLKASLIIKKLVDKKIFATINQTMDTKLAGEVARDFGATVNQMTFEEESTQELELTEVETDLQTRAPVVTIMGHVDHGKTSLLDSIRESNVADREAGGITQHIGAYSVTLNGRKIVFIDTPGHEAFTRMRARGAKVTDVVILVVAADDGVMPQTLEAIDHAKAAKVPIIVAINKVDKPDAQPERIKQQLADRGLLAEDWGGDTVMVPVSAKTKQNLDLLLEMILLVSELQNLRANPARPAIGTVLEAKLDRGRGPVATVLVQNGTLRVGDFFICGQVFGKVRAMFDDRGAGIRDAEPSTPVEVLGLDELPEVGDAFQVVTDTAKAKQIVVYRESRAREQAMSRGARLTLEQLHTQLREGDVKELNIILKTDVGGTAEVLAEMLQKLSSEKVRIRVLSKAVGAITETDVLLATTASDTIIVGFNVRPERQAQALAEKEGVDIRLHTIIYELTDEIKKAMTGMLEPVFKEVFRGRATVQQVFRISKVGTVAGCLVNEGTITRDSQVRLLRDNVVIHTGRIDALKRFKNDVSEVKSGFECGISLIGYQDIKENDVIEAFGMEKIAAEL
jgi:translation initiation factor IF-2